MGSSASMSPPAPPPERSSALARVRSSILEARLEGLHAIDPALPGGALLILAGRRPRRMPTWNTHVDWVSLDPGEGLKRIDEPLRPST